MTVIEALSDAAARLAHAGVTSAQLDAALLLAEVLGLDRVELRLRPGSVPSAAQLVRYEDLIARRVLRVPMSQLLGRCEFWSREFTVTPDVLTPRPETEDVIQAVLDRRAALTRAANIVDVGVGSGCIAVTLALELPSARVWGVDLSPAALAVAQENVVRHGVQRRVTLLEGSFLAPVAQEFAAGGLDVVVSNPPYVHVDEASTVDPEVLHEPRVAVFAPGAPAQVYRRLAEESVPLLREGGYLVCELPEDTGSRCRAAIASVPGLEVEEVRPDLVGTPRVLVAQRVPRA